MVVCCCDVECVCRVVICRYCFSGFFFLVVLVAKGLLYEVFWVCWFIVYL